MNYQNFLSETIDNNGATLGINGQQLTNGFLVSLEQFGEVIPLHKVESETIPNYVSKNQTELNKENCFLGSWINDGSVYLDVTMLTIDKRKAIEIAYKNNQLAIYDNTNKVVIELPTPQRTGTTTQQKAYLTQIIDKLCK